MSSSTNNFQNVLDRAKAIAAKLKEEKYDQSKRPAEDLADDEENKRKQIKIYKPKMIVQQINVPVHMAPLVLGLGGEALRTMEMACNCSIKMAAEIISEHRMITIKGEELSVTEAARQIDDIVNGSGSLQVLMGGHSQPGNQTIYVQVPTSRVGLVIGKGGETIRALQEKTGAKINVCKDGEMDNPPNTKTVVVNGPPHCINLAQQYIDDIVSGSAYAGQFGVTGVSETFTVPRDKVGLVIGKGGETIKLVQGLFGVKLNIDPNNDKNNERVVTISGEPDQIAQAKEIIFEKVFGNKLGILGELEEQGVIVDKEHLQMDAAYSAAYGMGVPPAYSQNIDYAQMMGYDAATYKAYVEYYAQYYSTLAYPTGDEEPEDFGEAIE